MSTKINTGFILRDTTLENAFEKIQLLRRDVEGLARVRMARTMGRKCATRLDRYAGRELFPDGAQIPRIDAPMSSVWGEMMDEHREAQTRGGRAPEVDFEFTMSLHPDAGDILGMSFVEETEWHRHWLASSGVESYVFYNNTDRPDDVSVIEWEERGRRWDAVLDRDRRCRPGYAGLTAHIHESDPPFVEVAEVLSELPTFEARSQKLAFELIHAHRLDELKASLDRSLGTSDIIGVLHRLQDHMDTDEGRAERDAMVARLEEYLVPDLTRDILIHGRPS